MLRPSKGEGERQLIIKEKLRRLFTILAVILLASPWLLIFATLISLTASFGQTLPSQQQQQALTLEALQSQVRNYLGQIPQKIQTSSTSLSPVSLSDLDSIQSTLQSLKNQGADTSSATAELFTLRSKLNAYNTAVSNLDVATTKLQEANTNLQQAQTNKESTAKALEEANSKQQTALDNYNITKAELQSAEEALTSQKQIFQDATASANLAQANLDTSASTLDNIQGIYNSTHASYIQASRAVQIAQENYDNSTVTVQGQPGINYTTYKIPTTNLPTPSAQSQGIEECTSGTASSIQYEWGGGVILNCQADFVMVHFYGYIKFPETGTYTFYSNTDDGFLLSINNTTVLDDWTLKACYGTHTGTYEVTADTYYPISVWMYEWGGGACTTLYYSDPTQSPLTPIPPDYYYISPSTTTRDPLLLEILNKAKDLYDSAYISYIDASNALDRAKSDYRTYLDIYNTAVQELNDAKTGLTKTQAEYDSKVINSQAAQEIYDTAKVNAEQANQTDLLATKTLDDANISLTSATAAQSSAQSSAQVALETYSTALANLRVAISQIQIPTPTPTNEPTTEPTPTPEPSNTAVPEVITVLEDVPLVGEAVKALEALQTVGLDMTPEVRKKAQQTVVATIIVSQVATTTASVASAASASRRNPTKK